MEPDCSGRCKCSQTDGALAHARRSRRRACPSGAGSCSGCARCRRRASSARSRLAEAEALVARQVAAPGVDVLAEQRQLAHAVGGQALGLGDQVGGAAATARARARRGRCSTSTSSCSPARSAARPGTAASRRSGRSPENSSKVEKCPRGSVAAGADRTRRGVEMLPGPEGQVDERVLLEQLVLHRLRPAAADHDPLGGVALAWRARASIRCADEAVVGLLADRAGVEHEHVGVGRRRPPRPAQRLQQALDRAPSRARSSGSRTW